MKRGILNVSTRLTSIFLLLMPLVSIAGWEVAKPDAAVPRGPFFQPGVRNSSGNSFVASPVPAAIPVASPAPISPPVAYNAPRAPVQLVSSGPLSGQYLGPVSFPTQATLGQPSAMYAISISGSLKQNVERILGRYHWKVIWKAPYDYNFDGRVTGTSLPNVVEKLLDPFPLQAVMYMSNRTVAVVPRYRT